MVERTGIIGTGLIGGSLALAFKRQGIGGEILGYDTDPASIASALEQGPSTVAAPPPANWQPRPTWW